MKEFVGNCNGPDKKPWSTTRPNVLQFENLKVCRSTFVNYTNFGDDRISRFQDPFSFKSRSTFLNRRFEVFCDSKFVKSSIRRYKRHRSYEKRGKDATVFIT